MDKLKGNICSHQLSSEGQFCEKCGAIAYNKVIIFITFIFRNSPLNIQIIIINLKYLQKL